jgi:hypothetical protein
VISSRFALPSSPQVDGAAFPLLHRDPALAFDEVSRRKQEESIRSRCVT